MSLKSLYLIENVDNDLICLLMIMKIICSCWLTVGSWIMFVVFFLNKTFCFCYLSTFALKSERIRFLQDFIAWLKCLETRATKTSPVTETAETELARPKSCIPVNCIKIPKYLTPWEPAYGIFVLGFRPKKQQFSVALPTP